MGPLPDYVRPSLHTLWLAAVYRLRWAASLANLGVKGRVRTNRHASDALKAELLLHDWHFGAIPDYVAEASGGRQRAVLRGAWQDFTLPPPLPPIRCLDSSNSCSSCGFSRAPSLR